MRIGSWLTERGCTFTVWAPLLAKMEVNIVAPRRRRVSLQPMGNGYWSALIGDIAPGTRYFLRPGGLTDRPDPASHFQPEGVHGPSEVVDHGAFSWTDDAWRGIDQADLVLYEMHTGCFTPEGTFADAARRLPELKATGITAIEIMPVAAFPGNRNWGYDGVSLFAVDRSYGGCAGLKSFVDACHAAGMAVVLDVVYNHLGPEGNYLREFAPYFIDKYKTPWGWAVNFDEAYSNDVRDFFIENALFWLTYYHIDGLRLDAVHAICDLSARPFLFDLASRVQKLGEADGVKRVLFAENELNDTWVIRGVPHHGLGIDGQWADDFHHALHTALTGESSGYYGDYNGLASMASALKDGLVYTGQFSAYHKRDRGSPAEDIACDQFVVFSQNHDQIGNRLQGERLIALTSFEAAKLAAAAVILSPFIPLLFMGEEYGEERPFLYFADHSDEQLIEAVRAGRKADFAGTGRSTLMADPFDMSTFLQSKLDWEKRSNGSHAAMLAMYRDLLTLRRKHKTIIQADRSHRIVTELGKVLLLDRWQDSSHLLCFFNFQSVEARPDFPYPGHAEIIFDSSGEKTLPKSGDSLRLHLKPWNASVLLQSVQK